jgi:outer membrane protein assembly factor BamA
MPKILYSLLFSTIVGSALLLSSCSNTRYLTEKESLYVGNKVEIKDSFVTPKVEKNLEKELSAAVRPKPNSSFLGIRFKLFIYNVVGTPKKEKGFRSWLRNKFGEPPVKGGDMNVEVNTKILHNYLENLGYLRASATGQKVTKKQRTKALFEVTTGPQTTLRNITYDATPPSSLSADIKNTAGKTFLKTGDPYNLQTIKNERERISNVLKMEGYYYFNPDYLLIVADTSIGNNQADLKLTLKNEEMPDRVYHQYRINHVVILADYRITNKKRQFRREAKPGDTVRYDGFELVDRHHTFKPSVFYQAMQLEPGELYNKNKQNIALNRLVTLGTFKFVKNEFTPVRDTTAHLLDLTYYLTPAPKKSFNFEIGGFSQEDSRVGSRASISWRNRNFLKGAELFSIKLSAGGEVQYGGESQRPNSYNLGLESSLNIPRFIVPFIKIKPSSMFIPRTLVTAKYDYTMRAQYYRINSYTLGFGYNWKEDIMKEHKLFPFNISYVRTDTLGNDSSLNINLSNLVYNGFIIGPTYEYTYNSQLGPKRIDNYYFYGSADFAGNIIGLINNTSLKESPKNIFGSPFAQYVKLQADFRYYHNYTENSVLATRIFLGFGLPYGNSQHLPNIKQFYSGGSSSLRGFGSRLVGPGTFNGLDQTQNNFFVEMLGDLKLEANAEWRMQLYKFIHGAVFADAGNIWLYRDNPDFPGGTFTHDFYKQLAVDAGLGLRFDFSILILRLDLGIPVRKPWYPEGNRWCFDEINFGDPVWRKNNLFLNLAIGYPF